MDLGLAGRKAIITGASRGIGRSVAHRLAAEGASVAVCARQADGVTARVPQLHRHAIVDRYGLDRHGALGMTGN